MKTLRPLKELLPDLIHHVKAHYTSHIVYNNSLIEIMNGGLLPYVEESMKKELNERAFERSKGRIPPINVLSKLITKTSKVYAESPKRQSGGNKRDDELFNSYQDGWDINSQLQYANDLLVINKYCALEPYMFEGEPSLRVLSANDFIVYSDSRVNPNEMSVFIKFMGQVEKKVSDSATKKIALFQATSDTEWVIYDEDGQIYDYDVNPYGSIPFIYLRSNANELIPTPDSDNLPMTTLVPKLMADLNYAVMFGCRSQIVGIDVEMENVEMSPDSMWILSSVAGEGKSPSLDTIKSDVDVEKVIALITTQLGLWLDTKGIKTGSVGKATVNNAASGISKLIDESDASAVSRRYKKIFQSAERRLWTLLPKLHTIWAANGSTDNKVQFSSKFKPSVELIDAKVVESKKDILDEMLVEQSLGIFNANEAIDRLNPDATEEERDRLKEALEQADTLRISNETPDNTEV